MICPGCADCFACRLRAKSVAVAPSATPTRTANRRQPFRRPVAPSWEKGTVSEARPGGTRMPYLDAKGAPIATKAWGENRRGFEQQVKRLKNDPNVFAADRRP